MIRVSQSKARGPHSARRVVPTAPRKLCPKCPYGDAGSGMHAGNDDDDESRLAIENLNYNGNQSLGIGWKIQSITTYLSGMQSITTR
nr:hypothetical protein BgiMline_022984 [Biomphalaria glabrata]